MSISLSKIKILECGDYSVCVQLNSSNKSPKFTAWLNAYYLWKGAIKPYNFVIYFNETKKRIAFNIIKTLKAGDTVVLYTKERIPDEVKQLVL